MTDDEFITTVTNSEEQTTEDQVKTGQAVAGKMDDEHKNFMKTLMSLIDKGEINPADPKTFLKMEVYSKIDEQWQDKTDLALLNIANQVKLIDDFRKSADSPDESPQLQTMVEQLWQMKQRIEETHDVFKF
ncbi:MAG: hypothetical protein O2904_04260 [bacterium]|nr:hypothetical protein [bacterium]